MKTLQEVPKNYQEAPKKPPGSQVKKSVHGKKLALTRTSLYDFHSFLNVTETEKINNFLPQNTVKRKLPETIFQFRKRNCNKISQREKGTIEAEASILALYLQQYNFVKIIYQKKRKSSSYIYLFVIYSLLDMVQQ